MCWYLFRVTPVTQPDINKIKSLLSKFLNQNIFPRIKWEIPTLIKCYGGLSITDPHVQQADLYFHRIQPLLLDTHLGRKTKVNKVLQIHIQNSYKAEHHQITLLFPDGRPYLPRHLHNTCPQLVKSLARIPREFS